MISNQDPVPDTVISVSEKPLRIAGRLKYDIFSADGSTGGKTTLIVSIPTFTAITGIDQYRMISIQLNAGAEDKDVESIRELSGNDVIFRDERDANNRGTYLAFIFCTYAFLAVIGLVAVLNIVNCISMRVSAGIRQYGTMLAVGMEQNQLMTMIAAEAGTYGIAGGVLGLVLGLPFSRWLYGYLVTSHFGYAHWTFPLIQILIIIIFLAVSVSAGVSLPTKQLKNRSAVEMIRSL